MENEITTPTPTENQTHEKKCKKSCAIFIFLWLILMLLIAAGGYGYFYLWQKNQGLTQLVAALSAQNNQNKSTLDQLSSAMLNLSQSFTKAQNLSSEQERLLNEWQTGQKNNAEKWRAGVAYSLTKMASYQLEFNHDITTTLNMLKAADSELQTLKDPNLVEVRTALANDIAQLQAITPIDITGTFARLVALQNQFKQLPLQDFPLQNKEAAPAIAQTLPWWKSGLLRTWESLKQTIVIRDLRETKLPLITPDEKLYLYQNLSAQIDNAIWGLLHNNPTTYQLSLSLTLAWVNEYFQNNAQATLAAISTIQELQKINVAPPTVTLSALPIFERYWQATTGQ